MAEDLLYKELDLLPSRAGGLSDDVAPHLVRWNSKRNGEFVVRLMADGQLRADELVTHVIPFREVKRAYEMIHNRSEPSLHVALDWRDA